MVFERKKCYCKLWAIEKSLCRDYVKVESCLVQELCLLKKNTIVSLTQSQVDIAH
jgi:hypothetical protein